MGTVLNLSMDTLCFNTARFNLYAAALQMSLMRANMKSLSKAKRSPRNAERKCEELKCTRNALGITFCLKRVEYFLDMTREKLKTHPDPVLEERLNRLSVLYYEFCICDETDDLADILKQIASL